MASIESKVYRLRYIPDHMDRLEVTRFVCLFLPDQNEENVLVESLAFSCEPWMIRPTKTATLSFKVLPSVISNHPDAHEWQLQDSNSKLYPTLPILDDHFIGLTPLNDVKENISHSDCIVLSGLSSHPMGSWQQHGKDKSFMWIRDRLPHLLRNIRFILYGYDTKLSGSKSFQLVSDIALSFIDTLHTGGWTSPGESKLAFLAHSLGGIILKEAFCLLTNGTSTHTMILDRTQGVIFFGVPSQGLNISDLDIMLNDQPNKDALINEISTKSNFLEELEEHFLATLLLKSIEIFWAYETEVTPTVVYSNGTYPRSGPETVFVSRASATSQRCESHPELTIQINSNHSDMVKFRRGDGLIERIAAKLQHIIQHDAIPASEATRSAVIGQDHLIRGSTKFIGWKAEISQDYTTPEFWDVYSVILAICAPKRDSRLASIESAAHHSFEWAFHSDSVGLTDWLQNESKLFWVSGKPASGKSTFMKYLHHNNLTSQYLSRWYRKTCNNRVRATFFFHHRGTADQKSLEGLYRAILSQILEQAPQSIFLVQPDLPLSYREAIESADLGSLSSDLETLMELCMVTRDGTVSTQLQKVLLCELPHKALHKLVVKPMMDNAIINDERDFLQQFYLHRDALLLAYKNEMPERAQTDNKPGHVDDILLAIHRPWAKYCTSYVRDWLAAVDPERQLSAFKDVLMARRRGRRDQMQPALDELIKEAVDRFRKRKKQRHRIETARWRTQQLRQAIDRVVDQQEIELDLCLFLDALDEHDGPPEFICHLIEDLTSPQESRTRLKILFSSRPWRVFQDAFNTCPKIQIHEYTEDDIRMLCLQEIPKDSPVLKLTEDIFTQARGVFLWVKLVVNDLLKQATDFIAAGEDEETMHQKLKRVLESLPEDLKPYYQTIIERIPYTHRLQTFFLLEIVAKSVEEVFLEDIMVILSCVNVENVNEVYGLRSKLPDTLEDAYASERLRRTVREYSGGLIEVIAGGQLQLLHQTVVEFVQLPEFILIVLEDRSRITKENGYSILLKYRVLRDYLIPLPEPRTAQVRCDMNETIAHYAQQAELTTGKCRYSFFEGIEWIVPKTEPFPDHYEGSRIYTTMEVALAGGLKLLLKETLELEKEKSLFTPAPSIFFTFLHTTALEYLDVAEVMDTLRHLMNQGLQIRTSYVSLLLLLDHIHYSTRLPDEAAQTMKFAIDLCCMTISSFHGLDTDFEIGFGENATPIVFSHLFQNHRTCKALHILSHHDFISYLLENNADPNGLTSERLTPLDCWVKELKSDRRCIRCLNNGLTTVRKIVEHGGRLNKSTRQGWLRCFSPYTDADLLPVPGWLEEEPVTRQEENMRMSSGASSESIQQLGPLSNPGHSEQSTKPKKLKRQMIKIWFQGLVSKRA